ncbi:thermonuclease family protein [Brachybacterium tyrofermentans]|uniref:thermonuclease family protein n=1 Tax=Brachybacterium tyrofermentans TaxID=47848 RepID=UPI003FD0294C
MNLASTARARLIAAGTVLLAVGAAFLFWPESPFLEAGQTPAATGGEATVVRVIDGDTLAVEPSETLPATNDEGTEHVVRVLGIDAPEMNYHDDAEPECGAQEATDYLEEMLPAGARVTLVHDGQADRVDRYGRTLAYVELEDVGDAGELLISDGYAIAWYPQSEPEPGRFPAYQASMTTARDADAGSWAHCEL